MTKRRYVLIAALTLVVAACGSGGGSSPNAGGGLGATTTTAPAAADCKDKTLTSSEIGVSDKEITITVMADVDNPFKPAVFEGAWNGVKAWADYVNAQGGLACRTVVVKKRDSKLNAEEAKNQITAACADSLALVGTTAVFLTDVSGMEGCKDKAGKATGIPDLADLQTESVQQCSDVSFPTLPIGASCPYSGTGERTFTISSTQYEYYLNKYKGEKLHGVFAIPKDTPSILAATTPIIRAENELGIASDAEFGMSALATQPEYTPLVQAIKTNKSNYARSNNDYTTTVLFRKEAAAQNIDTVRVWDCSVQCYDQRLITEGGAAVEDQYVWLNILPIEDGTGVNPALDAFIKYNKKPDGFGLQAFAAGMVFGEAVNRVVASNNGDPNSITRADLLDAIRNMHDYSAEGLLPPGLDIGAKKASTCLVGMQVQDGKFVRISPTEKGEFNCGDTPPVVLTVDPVKEFKG
jgi:ABC-type branched-subunit amino acid transport system substrate-binding protein